MGDNVILRYFSTFADFLPVVFLTKKELRVYFRSRTPLTTLNATAYYINIVRRWLDYTVCKIFPVVELHDVIGRLHFPAKIADCRGCCAGGEISCSLYVRAIIIYDLYHPFHIPLQKISRKSESEENNVNLYNSYWGILVGTA